MTKSTSHFPFEHNVEYWPIEKITPNPDNPRLHPPEQIERIQKSIKEFGFTLPLIVKPDGTLIAGHGRLEAARGLGFTELPVIVASNWTEAQARAYALVDNRLAENSNWDAELLGLEIGYLKEEFGDEFLEQIGLAAAGLEEYLQEEAKQLDLHLGISSSDPDETPSATEVTVTQPGDVWVLGNHRLICGDATDAEIVKRLLDGAKPNLMVTDPPYGVDYDPSWRAAAGVNKNTQKLGRVSNDDRADWREAWRHFPGDVAYVWHGALQARCVEESLIATGFGIRSQLIWAKDRFALSRGHYHWQHEPCFYAVRAGRTASWKGDRSQSTVWEIAAREDRGHGHGTQKPIECMRRAIENHTSAGDAVYDPFIGSGTTIMAAELTGRRAYGIEIDPGYVDVALRRWGNFMNEEAVLAETGESFSTVRARRLGAVG